MKSPSLRGLAEDFGPGGRFPPVPAAALLGAPTGAGPGGDSTAMQTGTYVPYTGWEQRGVYMGASRVLGVRLWGL